MAETQDNPKEEPRPAAKEKWASVTEIGSVVRTQWPKYLVDIVVIILGITISFALDNYKDERIGKQTEKVYLESLLTDIESDIEELDTIILQTKAVLQKTDHLTSLADLQEGYAAEFLSDIKIITLRPNFVSKDATFSDLRSSGNMQLITDVKLKGGLFEYYRLYESVKAVESSEREVANTLVAAYMLKHFSIQGIANGRDNPVKEGETLAVILKDVDFTNVVALRQLNRSELLRDYEDLLFLADRIQVKLKTLL